MKAPGYHNRQFGADLFWRPTPSDAFRVQYIRTDTQYPEAVADDYGQPKEAFGGNGTWIDYEHITEKWMAFGSYEAYDSGFRADTGFVPRVDVRTLAGQAQRRWYRGAGAWFNTLDLGALGLRTTDDGWTLTDQTVAAYVNYTGPYQTQFRFNLPRDLTVYEGVQYEYYRPTVYFGIKPSGRSALSVRGRFGGGVDYANSRPAASVVQVAPAVEYRPASRVSLQLSYNLDQLSVDGRPPLPGEPRPAQGDLSHQRPHLRARHPAIHGHQPRPGPLPVHRGAAHAAVLLAVPLLLQVQPADRRLRGLLGQLRRNGGQRPPAAEPDVLREARLRVGVLRG